METKETTYNGWTNYATWRVNLEIIDGTQWVKEDFVSDETELTVYDLSEHLKNVAEQAITENDTKEGLAVDYAMAFISEVNWYEIAQHVAENYPEWNVRTN